MLSHLLAPTLVNKSGNIGTPGNQIELHSHYKQIN